MQIDRRRAIIWWTLTIVVAGILFFLSLSETVYNATSPPGPLQVFLRKSYSVVAFAIVGYLFSRAQHASGSPKSLLYVAITIGLYSSLIEVAQDLGGSEEGFAWNGIDAACGLVGGFLGSLGSRMGRLRR